MLRHVLKHVLINENATYPLCGVFFIYLTIASFFGKKPRKMPYLLIKIIIFDNYAKKA